MTKRFRSSSQDMPRIALYEASRMNSSSVMVDPRGGRGVAPTPRSSMEKKRKKRDLTTALRTSTILDCSSNVSCHQGAEGKVRKRNKHAEEKKKKKDDEADNGEGRGYIHVRARKGEATDSHSRAERVYYWLLFHIHHLQHKRFFVTIHRVLWIQVRRERIRERMDLLRGLVPGCDKVMLIPSSLFALIVDWNSPGWWSQNTGKAVMLDEIINYVQFLQNQVEVGETWTGFFSDHEFKLLRTPWKLVVVVHAQFLSMKLASMNPIFYDLERFESSALQTSPFHQAAPEGASRSYTMKEASTPLLLHGQGPISLPQVCFWLSRCPHHLCRETVQSIWVSWLRFRYTSFWHPYQEHGSVVVQVADRRQELLHQVVFNNVCSFQ